MRSAAADMQLVQPSWRLIAGPVSDPQFVYASGHRPVVTLHCTAGLSLKLTSVFGSKQFTWTEPLPVLDSINFEQTVDVSEKLIRLTSSCNSPCRTLSTEPKTQIFALAIGLC